jgi:hypothetical protein
MWISTASPSRSTSVPDMRSTGNRSSYRSRSGPSTVGVISTAPTPMTTPISVAHGMRHQLLTSRIT